jgi:hypothetical protein
MRENWRELRNDVEVLDWLRGGEDFSMGICPVLKGL